MSAAAVPPGRAQAEAADEVVVEDVLDDGLEVEPEVEVDDEELLEPDDVSDDVLAGVELLDDDRESVR